MREDGPIENVIEPVESFVNNTLREELRVILNQQHAITLQQRDYEWLRDELKRQLVAGESLLKTSMVDIGADIYCEATLEKKDMLHVMLGYGFLAELTQKEALAFCEKKLVLLKKRFDVLKVKSQNIQGHIKELLLGVTELRLSAELGLGNVEE